MDMASKWRLSLSGKGKKRRKPFLETTAAGVVLPRNHPHFLFVFVGEHKSGKSKAISNIFKAYSPKQKNASKEASSPLAHSSDFPVLQRWGCKDAESGHVLEILEVTGLLRRNKSPGHDESIIKALSTFLRKESPTRNPVLLFITARLDDDYFEEEQSRFSQTLHHLLEARHLLTDPHCSNVVLLLTHADKLDLTENLQERIDRYKLAFSSVFHIDGGYGDPKSVLAIPLDKSSQSIDHFWLKLKEGDRHSSKFSLVQKFFNSSVMKQLDQMRQSKVDPYSYQSFKMSELSFLLDTAPPRTSLLNGRLIPPISTDKLIVVATEKQPLRLKDPNEPMLVFNCIQPQCSITLATGEPIAVEDLFVGDRVMGYRSVVGVVTKICRVDRGHRHIPDSERSKSFYRCKDCRTERFSNLFMIFLRGITSNTRPTSSSRQAHLHARDHVDYVYYYENETLIGSKGFMLKMYDPRTVRDVPLNAMKCEAYYVEVDNGTGTFIADGLVRACMALL